jgi:hypothetical protein
MEALGMNERKQVEIEHVGDFDIIVNWKQDSIPEDELRSLRDELISNSRKMAGNSPLKGWAKSKTKRGLLDKKINSKYFAKEKWLDTEYTLLRRALKINRGLS